MKDAITYRLPGQRPCYTSLIAAPQCLIPREAEDDFRRVIAHESDLRWTLHIAAIEREFRLRGAAATVLPERQDPRPSLLSGGSRDP